MKLQKVLAPLLAAGMLFGLAACSAPQESGEDGTYQVGIIQQMEHTALNSATEGFKAALTEKLGDKVEFDYQNAQGEVSNCGTIASKFVSSNVDLILANATSALQAAYSATATIPVIGVSITDFATAGVELDESGKPTGNVTGVSDLSPIDRQMELLKKLCPNVQKVAIVYCSSEPNSKFQSDLAEAALDEMGIAHQVYTVMNTNDITTVVTKAVAECDVMYIPTDNTMADNMGLVKNITLGADKKVPVIAGEENMCKVGGLATLSGSYYDMGYQAGLMAYEILVNGKQPSDFEIQYVTDGLVEKYNPEIAEELGVEIPEGMVALDME